MTDLISRQDTVEIFSQLWDCIKEIADKDEWEDVCRTTANELPSVPQWIPTDEIRVGDEVLYHTFYENSNQSHKGIVTNLGRAYSPYAFIMKEDGEFVSALLIDLRKTGRHFPQINEVLKQVRGEER